jgi:hypothetical protein
MSSRARDGVDERPSQDLPTHSLAFDSVTVAYESGSVTLSAAQFLEIGVHERIRLNFERRFTFHRRGTTVRTDDAMRSLMNAARAVSSSRLAAVKPRGFGE